MDRIKQPAPVNIFNIDDPPKFQTQLANGQLEKQFATVTLYFDIEDNLFAEHFVVKKLTGSIIGLRFMRHNSVIIDITHGLIHFLHLTVGVKAAASKQSAEPQSVLTGDTQTIPFLTMEAITASADHPPEWNTTGTVTPQENFTKNASLLISHSMSTINKKNVAVRVTNTTQSLHMIKRNTQIAEFNAVYPDQSKFFKPVDTTILSMLPLVDPDLTA